MLLPLLAALMVYLPIAYAAVIEERREAFAFAREFGFRPGDHRQWKRWR